MVDATIKAIYTLAFVHVWPGLTTQILRVAELLFLYSNPRSNTPRWMQHKSPGIEPGTFIMTGTALANWGKSPVNTADRIRSDSMYSVDRAFSLVGNSCNSQKIPGSQVCNDAKAGQRLWETRWRLDSDCGKQVIIRDKGDNTTHLQGLDKTNLY